MIQKDAFFGVYRFLVIRLFCSTLYFGLPLVLWAFQWGTSCMLGLHILFIKYTNYVDFLAKNLALWDPPLKKFHSPTDSNGYYAHAEHEFYRICPLLWPQYVLVLGNKSGFWKHINWGTMSKRYFFHPYRKARD